MVAVMGFFSSQKKQRLSTCKLCNRDYSEENYIADLGICSVCGITAKSFFDNYFLKLLTDFENKANSTTDADTKVHYLGAMLGILYEYKVKYQDNDVHLINGNIEKQIDIVIDRISHARN